MSALWRQSGKAIAPLLIGLLISTPVLADRGGRGGGGGGGGGNQSSRSFSGGGGGSSFSSRSSGGGGGSSSMRSFSDGGSRAMRSFSSGDGGSSRSFRSFSGGDSGGSSRSSFRSLSGNDGGSGSKSLRSFSGGDSGSSLRSLNNGSSGNSGSTSRSFSEGARIRSDFRPSVRSSDFGSSSSGGSSSESSSTSSISGGGSPSLRSLNSGTTSDGGSRVFSDSSHGNSASVSRTFSQPNGNNGVSQSGYQGRDGRSHVDQAQLQTFLNKQSDGPSSQAKSVKSDGRTTIYGEQFGSNNGANDQGGRNYQVRRASGDEVRNFLNMQNKTGSQGNENGAVVNGERSVLKGNGQSFTRNHGSGNSDAGNSNASVGDRVSKDGKQFKFNNGSNNDLNNNGNKNREWTTARSGERGDQLNKHLNLDKSKGPKLGDGRNFGIDKGFNRDGGDREFRGNDRARGEFKNWSKIWDGKKGEGHDHRDWSGKWRDGDRFDVAHDIRGDWHRRFDHHDHDRIPFCGGWWGDSHFHHHSWGFWNDYCVRWNRPWFWWSWTSAPVLYDWCGFGWSTPYYWDYGPGEYIYCNDGVVYVNGVWYQPAPVFYQQTVQMVEAAPVLAQEAAAQVEWLPLGVFAVTPDGMKEPSVTVQLAVTKEGVLGGTAFDEKAGKSYNIQGTVDKNTQRAVWSYLDDKNNRIYMETSVNNLTQNESTGLVHYGPNDMRVVEFVRLQEPDAKPADQPAAPILPPQGK